MNIIAMYLSTLIPFLGLIVNHEDPNPKTCLCCKKEVISSTSQVKKMLLKHLPKSSQSQNAQAVIKLIEQLQLTGEVILEGSDDEIRPASVGLQCLFEEMFVENSNKFKRADFEIHTTMPSTPCCKLPNVKAKESLLAAFKDQSRLITIDGRSASLDAICNISNATLHLTYTRNGMSKRSENQIFVFNTYWKPRANITCIDDINSFPPCVNGATYRLQTYSGQYIFFGIQATQAASPDSRRFIVHLGTKDQPAIESWLQATKDQLQSVGRALFERF